MYTDNVEQTYGTVNTTPFKTPVTIFVFLIINNYLDKVFVSFVANTWIHLAITSNDLLFLPFSKPWSSHCFFQF